MSSWFIWLLVGLGVGSVAVRRPAAAAGLVTLQTLLVGAGAVAAAPGRPHEFAVASALLMTKGLIVSLLVVVAILRTPEARPHPERSGLASRLGAAIALVLILVAVIPDVGLDPPAAEDGSVAMVAAALAMVLTRRATVFAVLAFLAAENGIAVAAVAVAGAFPLVVELGIAFDLVVLVAVAAVLQRRILSVFGTTDSGALREIRD